MGSLTALIFATPLFGFALSAPMLDGPPALPLVHGAVAPLLLHVDGDGAAAPAEAPLSPEEIAAEEADRAYSEALHERADVVRLHKPFGIATWASMTLTLILGGIQYHNLYGTFDDQGSNPCVTGDAIFGQGQCTGTSILHLSSALLTAGLYTTTFVLATQMPDPDDAASGDSEYATTLRLHKILRWVHFGGMIAQFALGLAVAHDVFGDRANDYDTLQGIATVHMGIGLVTYGALTWAMALML